MNPSADDELSRVGALSEPVRRDLYRYVVERGGDVTRDAAADALRISRSLAAFHLDKLVEDGLLDVSFRRLNGRRGPGAGRPSKLYHRSQRQVDLSLPPRRYELAAQLLAAAIEASPSSQVLGGLATTACRFGKQLGEQARSAAADDRERMTAAEEVLSGYGFEPFHTEDGVVRLRNCPFHALAQAHRPLVCGMNLSLMQGVVAGLQLHDLEAVLDPQPGMCCVAFRRRHEDTGHEPATT